MLNKILSSVRREWKRQRAGKLYESYDAAVEQAMAIGHTYCSDSLSRAVASSTLKYRELGGGILQHPISPMLCRQLWVLDMCRPASTFNVLDFGGAAGQHYFEARAYLPELVDIRWHVVEAAAMVEVCSKELASSDLHFFSNLEKAIDAFTPDLVFSSGALQCMPDPVSTLTELVNIQAKNLYISRASLCNQSSPQYIVETSPVACHGPLRSNAVASVAAIPLSIVPEDEFRAVLETRYIISFEFNESELYSNIIGSDKAIRRGYFCRLRLPSSSEKIESGAGE